MEWSTYLARGVSTTAGGTGKDEANGVQSALIVPLDGLTNGGLDTSASEDREHAVIEEINSLFRDTLSLTPFSRTIAIGFVRVRRCY
jgi:hypothetical protein